MAAVIDELIKEKKIKKTKVQVVLRDEIKKKAEELCKSFDISLDEYLGRLLENSEINKVHSKFLSEKKKQEEQKESSHEVVSEHSSEV